MERSRGGRFIQAYLLLDLLLSGVVLVEVAWILWDTQRWLSFAGFGALFFIMLLTPLFLAQQAAVFLLAMNLRRRKRWKMITASVLQILGLLLPAALACAIEDYTSWFSLSMWAQLVFSAGRLLLQPWAR